METTEKLTPIEVFQTLNKRHWIAASGGIIVKHTDRNVAVKRLHEKLELAKSGAAPAVNPALAFARKAIANLARQQRREVAQAAAALAPAINTKKKKKLTKRRGSLTLQQKIYGVIVAAGADGAIEEEIVRKTGIKRETVCSGTNKLREKRMVIWLTHSKGKGYVTRPSSKGHGSRVNVAVQFLPQAQASAQSESPQA